MTRPPETGEKAKKKAYQVSEGHTVCDFDGKRRNGGDKIMLTTEQARFFQKRGSITVLIEDDEDDTPTKTAEPAEPAKAAEPAKTAATGGTQKVTGATS